MKDKYDKPRYIIVSLHKTDIPAFSKKIGVNVDTVTQTVHYTTTKLKGCLKRK